MTAPAPSVRTHDRRTERAAAHRRVDRAGTTGPSRRRHPAITRGTAAACSLGISPDTEEQP